MLKGLTDLAAYQATNGPGGAALTAQQLVQIGDFTGDDKVTNRDIQGLLNYLANNGLGSVSAVPEPSAFYLMACAALGIAFHLKARKNADRWPAS
jgi:hypothetical protein